MRLTAAAALAAVFVAAPAAGAEYDYTKDPVLFVHGYFLGDAGSWTWLKAALEDAGWPPEYLLSFQFDSVVGCNPQHAFELQAKAGELMSATGANRFDLVCHSMGCLDARYYIKYLCGYEHVKDFVSIAGAHKGSVIACADPVSCGAAQVCVKAYDGSWIENEFLKDLNWCDITPGDDTLYTSIWTPYDEIIVPQENSIIEGAVNVMLTSLVGHALILSSPETLKYVVAGLDGGGTNDNLPTANPPCVTVCEDWSDPPDELAPPALSEVEGSEVEGSEVERSDAPGRPGSDDSLPEPGSGDSRQNLPELTNQLVESGVVPADLTDQSVDPGPGGLGSSGPLHRLPADRAGGCAVAGPVTCGAAVPVLSAAFAVLLLAGRRRRVARPVRR